MQIHSLDFSALDEDNYHLIGIHTTLEDYRLAYLLNKDICTNFSKSNFNLDFNQDHYNVSFSLFNYTNQEYDFDWFLIANSYKEERISSNSRFLFNSETRNYLIPEKKNIDYFIKIVGEPDLLFLNKTIAHIKQIPNVITSYLVDHKTLKSKDFLIF